MSQISFIEFWPIAIQDEFILLNQLIETDLDLIQVMHQDPVRRRQVLAHPIAPTRDKVRQWISDQSQPTRDSMTLAIRSASSKEFLGYLRLRANDEKESSVELGLSILRSGLGYGELVIAMLFRDLLPALNCHSASIEVSVSNSAAIRFWERHGFISESTDTALRKVGDSDIEVERRMRLVRSP